MYLQAHYLTLGDAYSALLENYKRKKTIRFRSNFYAIISNWNCCVLTILCIT